MGVVGNRQLRSQLVPLSEGYVCMSCDMTLSVFILDDHEVVRAGLRALIDNDPDVSVIGEANNVAEALLRIPALKPDVAILDVRLPDGTGIEVCREMRELVPQTACIMFTSYADDEALLASIMAGASGYLLKQLGGRDLLEKVKCVAAGQSLLDPTLTERLLDRLRRPAVEDDRLAALTPQERRILDCIAHGWTNRQIGEALYLAEKTVKNYVSNLLAKLGMQRRTEAAVFITKLNDTKNNSYRHLFTNGS